MNKDKLYLISEKELKDLVFKAPHQPYDERTRVVDNYLKDKQPVKLVAGGEVKFIGGDVHLGYDTEWEWTIKLSGLLDEEYKGKNIEIYIREVK
jgi:hypothetical protein